jgi:2-keto-4-pentenoate hydratase/2-oxohepta-3-ene-1,7-dioic acid hydratase in catechol pathway
MRLAVIEHDRRRRLVLVSGAENETVFDLLSASELISERNDVSYQVPEDLMTIIRMPDTFASVETLAEMIEQDQSISSARFPRSNVKFCAPVERPGKIVCLAGNYREHIAESGFAVPRHSDIITPQLFLKPATTIIGDGDDIVIGESNSRVGWEVELAVIMGQGGKNIAASNADDHIFGYTILNDVSERGLNAHFPNRSERDKFFDWLGGKWFDTFAPCGPWIVTKDEIGDPHNLAIKLSINGEVRQRGNTGEMIHRIPETIAYVSSIMRLEPGDIISTGTPVGAGLGGASTSLNDGDEVICEIERIGTLRNRVRCAA